MLLVQYGYIFLVLIFLLLFSSPEGLENKETKISELGKYISYCTLSRAITITYYKKQHLNRKNVAMSFNIKNKLRSFILIYLKLQDSTVAYRRHIFPLSEKREREKV